MDIWGIGCILFEVMALYPLFPGKDEADQIDRVHKVTGTPDEKLLSKFKKYSSHVNFNFKRRQGTGIRKLVPHASAECLELMEGMLQYDPELRWSAKQCLKHAWFAELRANDKSLKESSTPKSSSKSHSTSGDSAAPRVVSESKTSESSATGFTRQQPNHSTKPKDIVPSAPTTNTANKPFQHKSSQPGPASSSTEAAVSAIQTSSHGNSHSTIGQNVAYGQNASSSSAIHLKPRRKKPHISKSLSNGAVESGQPAGTMQQLGVASKPPSLQNHGGGSSQYAKYQSSFSKAVHQNAGAPSYSHSSGQYGQSSSVAHGAPKQLQPSGAYSYSPTRRNHQPTHPSIAAATAHAHKSYYNQSGLQSMSRVQGRHQPYTQAHPYVAAQHSPSAQMIRTMPVASSTARQAAPYWSQQAGQKTSKVYSYTNAKSSHNSYAYQGKQTHSTPVRAPPRKKATNKSMRSKYPIPNFG